MTILSKLLILLSFLMQTALYGSVVYIAYFIYTYGLKALIDAVWMGFGA